MEYNGYVTGYEGKNITYNATILNKKLESYDVTFNEFLTFGSDGSVGLQLGGGWEVHKGLGTYNSFGFSHTTSKGVVSGMEISYKPGELTAALAGLAAIILDPEFIPELGPATLRTLQSGWKLIF